MLTKWFEAKVTKLAMPIFYYGKHPKFDDFIEINLTNEFSHLENWLDTGVKSLLQNEALTINNKANINALFFYDKYFIYANLSASSDKSGRSFPLVCAVNFKYTEIYNLLPVVVFMLIPFFKKIRKNDDLVTNLDITPIAKKIVKSLVIDYLKITLDSLSLDEISRIKATITGFSKDHSDYYSLALPNLNYIVFLLQFYSDCKTQKPASLFWFQEGDGYKFIANQERFNPKIISFLFNNDASQLKMFCPDYKVLLKNKLNTLLDLLLLTLNDKTSEVQDG